MFLVLSHSIINYMSQKP